jgi:hypothetical protein
MKYVLYSFILLISLFVIILIFTNHDNIKSFFNNINKKVNKKSNFEFKLNRKEKRDLYLFLETKYNNIMLPKKIIFIEINNYFEIKDFKFISDGVEKTINIQFIPINNNSFITKYYLFNRYGNFKLDIFDNNNTNNNFINDNNIYLSSNTSSDINLGFDLNDIITENIDSEDTILNTTENN